MSNFQTLFNVQGLTAVITGGSGALGSVMAHALAEAGVRVAILSRHLLGKDPVSDLRDY